MIQATAPTETPQITFIEKLPSGLSGEMPVELTLAIAEVFESAEVTKQMNALMT